jgi:hypothetical protein
MLLRHRNQRQRVGKRLQVKETYGDEARRDMCKHLYGGEPSLTLSTALTISSERGQLQNVVECGKAAVIG